MMKLLKNLGISGLIVFLDQAIKLMIRRCEAGKDLFTLPGVLSITRQTNTGMAFSMAAGQTALIALVSAALLAGILYYSFCRIKLTEAGKTTMLVLLGGAVGNMIDRVLLDGVTDYIRLQFICFPVFNFADICITGSVGILMILLLTGRLEEEEKGDGGVH